MSTSGSRRVLVTGGAGFIGSSLSIALARHGASFEVTAFDNLKRRGAELNLPRLRAAGVRFVHGDVRQLSDPMGLDPHDVLVERSAEPSVLASYAGTQYVFQSNVAGAFNCLELARRDGAQVVFLSTSRVYPVGALRALSWELGADARVGDHVWWISGLDEFRADYPGWRLTHGVEDILREIYERNVEHWAAKV